MTNNHGTLSNRDKITNRIDKQKWLTIKLWYNEWMKEVMFIKMIGRMNEYLMVKIMNEWMNEWTNEWIGLTYDNNETIGYRKNMTWQNCLNLKKIIHAVYNGNSRLVDNLIWISGTHSI